MYQIFYILITVLIEKNCEYLKKYVICLCDLVLFDFWYFNYMAIIVNIIRDIIIIIVTLIRSNCKILIIFFNRIFFVKVHVWQLKSELKSKIFILNYYLFYLSIILFIKSLYLQIFQKGWRNQIYNKLIGSYYSW